MFSIPSFTRSACAFAPLVAPPRRDFHNLLTQIFRPPPQIEDFPLFEYTWRDVWNGKKITVAEVNEYHENHQRLRAINEIIGNLFAAEYHEAKCTALEIECTVPLVDKYLGIKSIYTTDVESLTDEQLDEMVRTIAVACTIHWTPMLEGIRVLYNAEVFRRESRT